MSTEDIDRSLVEFAQKIAAIPKGIADEGRPTEPPAVSRAAPPAAAEVGSRSLPPPRFPPASNPIRAFGLLRLPARAANRFVTQKKSQASS